MSLFLPLVLHQWYQKKVQRTFEANHNKVLDPQEVQHLLHNCDDPAALATLHSAVGNHEPVNGVSYHLSYPVTPVHYHDGYKRAEIAWGLSRRLPLQCATSSVRACAILERLIDGPSAGYAETIAWHALGKLCRSRHDLRRRQRERIGDAFEGRTASVMGALCFLDRAFKLETDSVSQWLDDARRRTRYRTQKALVVYYDLRLSRCCDDSMGDLIRDEDLQEFLRRVASQRQSSRDLCLGMREIGLLSSNQTTMPRGRTPQAVTARRLTRIASPYLAAVGVFLQLQDEYVRS